VNAVKIGALAAGFILAAGGACAQGFPNKPLRMVTSDAGGGNDFQARLIARGLSAAFGQQVVIENRPSGVIPGEIVAKASPNGYTLLLYNNALWTGPLMQRVSYDPVKDFAPVTTIAIAPNVLVVNGGLPVKSVGDLIALARAKPGQLNYASSGTGASNHLAAELFKTMAGVNIVRIGYKGAGQALNDLNSGQVQVMFPTAGAIAQHIQSGRVKALAVTSAEPSTVMPGLPTVAAAGLPGYESIAIYGVFAPAGTPRTLIQRLHDEIVRVLATPDVRDKFFVAGIETVGDTPEQLAARVRSEMTRMRKVIADAGIRVE
jgi:tripartite-type tricarboxylate transporter receptor subunit TctC